VADLLPVLLLVDDDALLRRALGIALSRRFTVLSAPDVDEATRTLRLVRVHIVLTDFHLPDGTGLDVLREAQLCSPTAMRVLMSASEEALALAQSQALAAMVLLKPFDALAIGRLLAGLVVLGAPG